MAFCLCKNSKKETENRPLSLTGKENRQAALRPAGAFSCLYYIPAIILYEMACEMDTIRIYARPVLKYDDQLNDQLSDQ